MTDHPIDPYWVPHSTYVREAVAEVLKRLQNYEKYYENRKRARREADQAHFERSISAIVCAVIQCYLNNKNDCVSISLSKRDLSKQSRYQPFSFGKTLPYNLAILTAPEMGFLKIKKGERVPVLNNKGEVLWQGRRTTLQPGSMLKKWIGGTSWIKGAEVRPFVQDDFRRVDEEEVIILKAEKKWHGDKGEWLDYTDTEQTKSFRQEVRSINDWIAEAEILYAGPQKIDTSRRRLKRYFNNSRFDHSGRLMEGFWQDLSKDFRRRHIRIGGKNIAELDYGQSTLRILYGITGAKPAQDDLYSIPGYENNREGIKLILQSALTSDRVQKQMPSGGRPLFGKGPKYADILAAVRKAHAPISEHFFTGVGMNLMYRESEILIDVLLEAMDRKIVALPIHDSVLVPQWRSEEVRDLMLNVFKRHTGVSGKVQVE